MILDQIVAYKKEFLEHCRRKQPLKGIKSQIQDTLIPYLPFYPALRRGENEELRVIAEVKKASPSKGIIREDFDPVKIALDYENHQADAISVLTDEEFFKGHLDYLVAIRREVQNTPLLRKDFTIDEYQIYEAKLAGASAILLIVGILDKHQLQDYRALADELQLGVITEVHLEKEADLAAELGHRCLGINNRDLRDFRVDLQTTKQVLSLFPDSRNEFIFISESGLSQPADIEYVSNLGVDAILVGESLMRKPSPGRALDELLGRSSLNEEGKQGRLEGLGYRRIDRPRYDESEDAGI
jgi:indole-3-glycerol phosphate synthase